MARSIRDLEPAEVLSLAIGVETRNAQRYDTFALLFRGYNDPASELFEEMRDEELEHKAGLQAMYEARFGGRPREVDERDVDEVVEAVDVDDAEHMVFDTLTRREVLEAARRAEEGAQRFYAGLCETVRDEELLALYRRLAEYEDNHLVAVDARIRELDREKGARGDGSPT